MNKVEFRNVTLSYGKNTVVKGFNLAVKDQEIIGIVGPSGCGKTTIIRALSGLKNPDSGEIYVDGKPYYSKEKRANVPPEQRNIGVVFQETYLFSGSVFENIAYARPDASLEEVIAAAKAANAHEFVIKLPDGYNTTIGENGHTLSGGERQRISIARAILKNPQILILDEATSSLDPETEIKIQEALSRLTKGRTTIAIAHRLATLRNADRLVVIEKGHIAECGSHEELVNLGGIYHDLVMAQRQTAKLKN
jgi:ATP-binding cassette subfamily B protein